MEKPATIREELEIKILTTIVEEFGKVKDWFNFDNLKNLVRGRRTSRILQAITRIDPTKTGEDEQQLIFERVEIAKALKNICSGKEELFETEKFLLDLRGNGQGC